MHTIYTKKLVFMRVGGVLQGRLDIKLYTTIMLTLHDMNTLKHRMNMKGLVPQPKKARCTGAKRFFGMLRDNRHHLGKRGASNTEK